MILYQQKTSSRNRNYICGRDFRHLTMSPCKMAGFWSGLVRGRENVLLAELMWVYTLEVCCTVKGL